MFLIFDFLLVTVCHWKPNFFCSQQLSIPKGTHHSTRCTLRVCRLGGIPTGRPSWLIVNRGKGKPCRLSKKMQVSITKLTETSLNLRSANRNMHPPNGDPMLVRRTVMISNAFFCFPRRQLLALLPARQNHRSSSRYSRMIYVFHFGLTIDFFANILYII